ncbi:MAG: membrane protein of unknown function [Promethearchaeota archaeon]|nr:MAG: membrane protein of unknown function [Candidatus Lokiarchaeota archaeon]
MLINWLYAEGPADVGLSFLDFYSVGHICMGIGIFLLFSLLYTIPMGKEEGTSQIILPLWAVWVITVIAGIAWEIIENTLFFDLGLKFELRADSIPNIISDIIFVAIGGAGMWIFAHLLFKYQKKIWPYYVLGLLGLVLWIGIFLILRFFTLF